MRIFSMMGLFSLATGALWGLANAWCLTRAIRCVVEGRQGWRLAGWVALKLVGLYGSAAWMLAGLRLPAVPWLAGFTISLALLGWKTLRLGTGRAGGSVRTVVFFSLIFLLQRLAEAAEEAVPARPHPPEIPNFITLITHFMPEGPVVHFLETWENAIFAFVIVGLVGGLIAWSSRRLAMRPGRAQTFVEMLIEGLEGMVCGVLGKEHGRRFLPFIGTLFIFILTMNLAILVPGLKSPTSRFEMTFSLALCVFLTVQWTAVKSYGFFGYLYHLMNEPRDPVGWVLAPLMFFIEVVGEVVKPVSLALRLFGNIMGEDMLLGVFVVLGALTFAWSKLPIGIPLHLPFVLLVIIFSTVQALVFTSLSVIYIYMKLPYKEGH